MTPSTVPCLHDLTTDSAITLRGRIITLGASSECHLRLGDPDAPQRAGHLLYKAGGYSFQAFNAKAATINGERCESARRLIHGDIIAIGNSRFRYCERAEKTLQARTDFGVHAEVAGLIQCVVAMLGNREGDVASELVSSVSRLLRCDAARLVVENVEKGQRHTVARFPHDSGIERFSNRAIDWARDKAATVLMNQFDWEDEDSQDNSVIKNSIASIVCGVLVHDGETIGYLYLDRLSSSPPFTEDDRSFCDALLPLFSQILATYRQRERQRETIERLQSARGLDGAGIIYESQCMAEVMQLASRVAATDVPILINGETGTGKELMARFLHDHSPRKNGPFKAVNSGAIPANLIESELFGHEKGAFTGATSRTAGFFEAAEGGTLFLDEISELPLPLQVKLLRALQESEITRVGGTAIVRVNVRIIAATNRDLNVEVAQQRFRQDLFFRLNVLSITVPPLRDRGRDLALLADFFVTRFCQQFGIDEKRLSTGAYKRLFVRRWPGNIRELENVIQKAIIRSASTVISGEDIETDGSAGNVESIECAVTLKQARNDAERRAIEYALKTLRGNVSKASAILDIDRKWLIKKMEELGIDPDRYRQASARTS